MTITQTAGATLMPHRSVSVIAPARLHLGLLNLSGLFDRVDGGLGVSITDPRWQFHATTAEDVRIEGLQGELHEAAGRALHALCDEYSVRGLTISVQRTVPVHAGLGSKTSLLMALGYAVCQLTGNPFDVARIASVVGRGGTSGAGVNLAHRGGVVWDSGHRFSTKNSTFGPSSASAAPAPKALSRLFPNDLHIAHFRYHSVGPNGMTERKIFAEACPIPAEETTSLLSLVSGLVLPCLADEAYGVDLQTALAKIQGLGLKRAEWEAQEDITLRFREYWHASDVGLALCLSSMGPTMFVLAPDLTRARQLVCGLGEDTLHYTEARVSDSGIAVATP